MPRYDVAIVGGGPAGATLARLLGGHGDVLLLDDKTDSPQSFRKPCGGLLSGDAQKALSRYGLTLPKSVLVDPQIFAVKTLDLGTGRVRHYQRFYVNLDRHAFDLWMKSLIPSRVTQISEKCLRVSRATRGFHIETAHGAYEADALVGADGANSLVRRAFFPDKIQPRHIAIQQWFDENNANPFYSCVFDPALPDCCSWSISKDSMFLFGGVFPLHGGRAAFDRQKTLLARRGFVFGTTRKTEACLVMRPRAPWDFCLGEDGVFLVGEAAGFISPSSFEGVSWAIRSSEALADAMRRGGRVLPRYAVNTLPLRLKLTAKMCKRPFMYNPFLRDIVLRTGFGSIDMHTP